MEGPNAEGAAPEPTLAAALTLVARPGYHLPCLQCGTRNARYEELPTQCPHFSKAKGLFAERAVHERSAKLNALLRASYFIIGIRAAGLATGPMAGFDAEGIDKEFLSDGEHSGLAVVKIGRPGENAWFTRSPRLTYGQVVTTVRPRGDGRPLGRPPSVAPGRPADQCPFRSPSSSGSKVLSMRANLSYELIN